MLAVISLGANLVLAFVWLSTTRARNGTAALPVQTRDALAEPNARTNLVVRRQPFSWKEIESPDYATYIANLRDIGCPEQTIRDIIIADVNAMYARRYATELVSPQQQWWRSEPDPQLANEAREKAAELEQERHTLLANLLGPSWEGADMASLPRPTREGIVLDGPVLGILPDDIKQALQDIYSRSQDRMEAYLKSRVSQGQATDPGELAKMRRQMREELAQVLAPGQMEEYLLRHSQTASELRAEFGQLRYFSPTPEEFRAVFRSIDPIEQRLLTLTGNDPGVADARRALEAQRENALRLALGDQRYEEYRLLQDPLYRQAFEAAQQAGTPEAVRMLYQVNLAAAEQTAGIAADGSLTTSQQNLALKQLELEQMTANALATGQQILPEGPPPIPTSPPRRVYVARPNDSIGVVALIHGVPVSAIRQANPGLNLRALRPGDRIVIPPMIAPFAAP